MSSLSRDYRPHLHAAIWATLGRAEDVIIQRLVLEQRVTKLERTYAALDAASFAGRIRWVLFGPRPRR